MLAKRCPAMTQFRDQPVQSTVKEVHASPPGGDKEDALSTLASNNRVQIERARAKVLPLFHGRDRG